MHEQNHPACNATAEAVRWLAMERHELSLHHSNTKENRARIEAIDTRIDALIKRDRPSRPVSTFMGEPIGGIDSVNVIKELHEAQATIEDLKKDKHGLPGLVEERDALEKQLREARVTIDQLEETKKRLMSALESQEQSRLSAIVQRDACMDERDMCRELITISATLAEMPTAEFIRSRGFDPEVMGFKNGRWE